MTHTASDRSDETLPPPAPPVAPFAAPVSSDPPALPPAADVPVTAQPAPPAYAPPAPHPSAYGAPSYGGTPWVAPPFAAEPREPGKGIATAALITAIGSLLLCGVPVLGIMVSIAVVILGIVALAQRQPRSVAVTAIALGGVTLVAGVVFTSLAVSSVIGAYSSTFDDALEAPAGSGGERAEYDPSDFVRLDDDAYDALIADPVEHYGDEVLLFGVVDSYAEESGCTLFLTVGNTMATAEADYDVWAFAYLDPDDGEWCSETSWVLPGDHTRFEATVRGTTTIEYEDGTAEEMPTFEIHRIDEIASIP